MPKYFPVFLVLIFVIPNLGFTQQSPPVADEYMSTDSLLIMNKLPVVTAKDSLLSLLGSPDSTIVRDQGEMCTNYFYSSCPNLYEVSFWDKSKFETCKNQAVVQVINFKRNPDLFVTYANKITLSAKTSVSSLKEFYPNSVSELHRIDVYQEGSYETFSLPSKKVGAESAWKLFFRNKKLVRMDYWRPC
ncbi:MAG: hypothetical protein U5J63_01260 [Fodinibius sp.]|nr:hypothetical protein [Fodinibius sp.]